jgi:glycosyltransferase involved in cell wall biosynthesis
MAEVSEWLPLTDSGLVLTVLIPTRSRVQDVRRCAQEFVQQVEDGSLVGRVEVLVVDNCSTDATAVVIKEFARQHSCLRYERHFVPRDTAETSLFHAIQFARGRWIWSFGDDDTPKPGSILWLVSFLQREHPSFVLANCLIRIPDSDVSIPYFEHENAIERYPAAVELFRKYGLVSATTTISCLVFERGCFRLGAALELAGVSQIYSHSAAMLVSFRDLPAAFVGRVICEYKQNTMAEEAERLSVYCRGRGMLLEELFTRSVGALAAAIQRRADIDISEIARFEEPEFSKTDLRVVRGPLWAFVMRFADARLTAVRERRSELVLRSDVRIVVDVTVFLWNARCRRLALRYAHGVARTIITALRRRAKRIFVKGS